ncbi:MAG: CocE/NonD family hydrolase [Anaerolineae bacterium]
MSRIRLRLTHLFALLVFGLISSVPVLAQDSTPEAAAESPSLPYASVQSIYIPMRDGVQIAVDVYLPHTTETTLPAIIRSTRYIRMFDRQPPAGEDLGFILSGYALVLVDARGSGASTGQRLSELPPDEIADLSEIVDWIVSQPWSNGRVGAYGVSYDGDTAEMTVVPNHPAVQIVAPLYADFDVNSLFAPGGLMNDWFGTTWGHLIGVMDANDMCTLAEVEPGPACVMVRLMYSSGIKHVDADTDGSQLAQIVAERQNVDISALVANAQFIDDFLATETTQYAGSFLYADQIRAANVPMLVWAGWLDAATADGAIARYLNDDNPQIVVLTPFSHGGTDDANPFNAVDTPVSPSSEEQFMQRLAYFDAVLKNGESLTERSITYYTFGADTWTTTDIWPPAGFETPTRWYFGADGQLTQTAPTESTGADTYTVDFTTTTGTHNRWYTQIGGDIYYENLGAANVLTYTSEPLTTPVEITGAAEVAVQLSSTAEDGALYVYLEDVAPDGTVTYITEGELRLSLRQPYAEGEAPYQVPWTMTNPFRAAYEPLVPGQTTAIRLHLYNTSALIQAGHRLRIALAGADADTFRRYPAEGAPALTIERNAAALSYVDLPMLERP